MSESARVVAVVVLLGSLVSPVAAQVPAQPAAAPPDMHPLVPSALPAPDHGLGWIFKDFATDLKHIPSRNAALTVGIGTALALGAFGYDPKLGVRT